MSNETTTPSRRVSSPIEKSEASEPQYAWFRLAAQRDHLVGIDPNFFEVCSPAMDTHSILRLSRSNTLDLLKLATLALHPLVDGFHFCYQHGYLLTLTATI
jgi:hypothetical protein